MKKLLFLVIIVLSATTLFAFNHSIWEKAAAQSGTCYTHWHSAMSYTANTTNEADTPVTKKKLVEATAINTISDTICYNDTTVLTAYSPIGFPQYYSWWAQDKTTLLKRDTINSGVSQLKLEYPLSSKTYYVNVSNDSTSAYKPEMLLDINPTRTFKGDFLLTSDKNNKTTILASGDSLNFYDSGGKTGKAGLEEVKHTIRAEKGHRVVFTLNSIQQGISGPYGRLTIYGDTTMKESLGVYDTYTNSTLKEPKTFISTRDCIIITWSFPSAISAEEPFCDGWEGSLYTIRDLGLVELNVDERTFSMVPHHFTAPNAEVCYDGTADLTARVPNFTYPQHISWWSNDKTTLLKRDTLNTPDEMSHFNPKNVRSNTTYYLSADDIYHCPYVPGVHELKVSVQVTLKRPLESNNFAATNDTVCAGSTASLTASSNIAYPQYYTWWDKDQTTLLWCDTVTSGISHFNPARQISDSLYYVHVSNDDNCPYVPGVSIVQKPKPNSYTVDFKRGVDSTIMVNCGDEIKIRYEHIPAMLALTAASPSYIRYHFVAAPGSKLDIVGYAFDKITAGYFKVWKDGKSKNVGVGPNTNISVPDYQNTDCDSLYFNIPYNKRQDFYFIITGTCEKSILAESHVSVKAPPVGHDLVTATNDTVCYDNTASLTASSDIAYPQYYNWWDKARTTLLYSDTVNSGVSQFNPANQISDSLYYVNIYNDKTCPYDPEAHKSFSELRPAFLFNTTSVDTTFLAYYDSIPFFDAGGETGDVKASSSTTYYQIFKAAPGSQIVLHIDTLNLYTSSTYGLKIYDGKNSSGTLTNLYGAHHDTTITSTSGYLYLVQRAYSKAYMGWKGYITTTCHGKDVLTESQVAVLPYIAPTNYYSETCQSSEPYSYENFKNIDVSTAGNYTIDSVYKSAVTGCDSVVTLNLTVNPSFNESADLTLCQSELPYTWRDTTFQVGTVTSDYVFNKQAVNGCDSVVTLHLTVNPSYNESVSLTLRQSELPYTWRDTIFQKETVTDDYVFYRQTVNGCDSVVTLHLMVKPYLVLFENEAICQSELPYTWRDTIFQVGTVTGTYVFHRQTVDGGDSTVTLHLTVTPSYNQEENLTLCQNELPYEWRDTTFKAGTVTDDYIFNRQTVNGCDSIVTLHLTVNPSYNESETATICQSELPYEWCDTTFKAGTTTGDYIFNKQTVDGCDSIVTLHLTVKMGSTLITVTNDTVCYNNTAALTASSTISYPQYYIWWDKNMNILAYDNINSGVSHFNPENQIRDSLYYVTVTNDTTCPIALDSYLNQEWSTEFHMTLDKANQTTGLSCGDGLNFYCDAREVDYGSSGLDFYHTFKAEPGKQVVFNLNQFICPHSQNGLRGPLKMEVYDGETTSSPLLNVFDTYSRTTPYTCTSTSGSLTIRIMHYGVFSGLAQSDEFIWKGTVTTSCMPFAEAHVKIKRPLGKDVITATNDTVCYGNTADLMALSNLAYPQYFNWWNKDHTVLLASDTVYSAEETTHFKPENQISDSIYLVYVYDSLNCPFDTNVYSLSSDFWMTMDKASHFTTIYCGDTLNFYDSAGPEADYSLGNNPVTQNRPSRIHHTFVAEAGKQVVFTMNMFNIGYSASLYIYDGPSINSPLLNVWNARSDKTTQFESFTSTNGALTVEWLLDGEGPHAPGWDATITTDCDFFAESHVTIRKPLNSDVVATSDVVCYDNTAHLTASSNLDYPQYYNWWAKDKTTLLGSDTVYSADEVAHFNPEHQIFDSVYYVNVYDSLNCPYDPEAPAYTSSEDNNWLEDFNMHPHYDGKTTQLNCGDILNFYDSGGKTGNYFRGVNTNHTFKAPSGGQVVLTLNSVEFPYDCCELSVYDGDDSQLFVDYGKKIYPQTITSTAGSLKIEWFSSDNCSPKAGWEGTVSAVCPVEQLAEAQVVVHPYIAPTNYYSETCQSSEPYSYENFKNIDVSTAGNYTIDSVFKSEVTGCDSVVTLNLTVNPSYNESADLTLCQSELPYTWRDTTFQVGTVTSDYVFNKQTVNGCDSIVTLHLTINNSVATEFSASSCGSYTWNSSVYTASGDYIQHFETANGCDSTVTLHLSISNSIATEFSASCCVSYTWNDSVYTASGDYIQHFETASGCDSIVTLHLTVNPAALDMDNLTDYIRCNGGSFSVMPTGNIPEGTLYTWTVEDNANVTGQSAQTTPVTAPISQTLTNNSDSKQTVVYTVTPITDGCTVDEFTITVEVEPTSELTLTCPVDIYDTLEFGSCALMIAPEDLGTPTWANEIGLVLIDTTNTVPADNMYLEGDNIVLWSVTDECGYTQTCEQHITVKFPECPVAIDAEGNEYNSVRIGCDCWIDKNLTSQKYSDGTDIPGVFNYHSETYPDEDKNVEDFGRLYDWKSAIKDSTDNDHGHIQGICPEGWYLPSIEQYAALNTYGANALMSPLFWMDGGGTNETGFSALPAGYYDGKSGRFMNLMGEARFWSLYNENGSLKPYSTVFKRLCDNFTSLRVTAGNAYCVRCIKEKEE